MKRVEIVAAVAMLIWSGPLFGQIPLLERGPEHEKLEFLIGEWQAETQRFVPEMNFDSRVTFSWKHGGAWLFEEERVDLPETGTIWNFMTMAYHPREKRWNGAYWDNVSPTVLPLHATWRDDRTLALDSGDIEFSGRPHRVVTSLTRVDECRLRREMAWSWDGGELERVLVSEMRKTDCR